MMPASNARAISHFHPLLRKRRTGRSTTKKRAARKAQAALSPELITNPPVPGSMYASTDLRKRTKRRMKKGRLIKKEHPDFLFILFFLFPLVRRPKLL